MLMMMKVMMMRPMMMNALYDDADAGNTGDDDAVVVYTRPINESDFANENGLHLGDGFRDGSTRTARANGTVYTSIFPCL